VALQELGYEVINVKQMTVKCPSPEGEVTLISLPLYLITLVRNQKSLDIFKISRFCNIIVKVEAYKSKSSLGKCYNCQRNCVNFISPLVGSQRQADAIYFDLSNAFELVQRSLLLLLLLHRLSNLGLLLAM
jgi:hypothetical protein